MIVTLWIEMEWKWIWHPIRVRWQIVENVTSFSSSTKKVENIMKSIRKSFCWSTQAQLRSSSHHTCCYCYHVVVLYRILNPFSNFHFITRESTPFNIHEWSCWGLRKIDERNFFRSPPTFFTQDRWSRVEIEKPEIFLDPLRFTRIYFNPKKINSLHLKVFGHKRFSLVIDE